MPAVATSIRQTRSLAVSAPGGMARQCVVQYQPVAGGCWQRYASFLKVEHAQHCLDHLEQRGYRTRVVIHHICPATT
ncbi:MAG: hypothetical protein GY917_06035 [Planctomycetaceae bacterium]|nr:hypothetical protein [Planctomycetaceae bacterium]